MKPRLITMICLVAALAGRAAAQGAVYGDLALAGSVSLTNLYGQPAAVWAAQRQGGAWTNDGAHVWYRLAATNRHGRSGWVYSTNDVVLNVATGRQSATVSWTNALGGVSGYLLQRRETTNSVADPAAATNAALWTRWQALSPRVGAVLDISWTNWSTNAWADLPGWDHSRTYPWATPADIAAGTVAHAATAGTVTGGQSNTINTALQPSWAATGTVAHAGDADRAAVADAADQALSAHFADESLELVDWGADGQSLDALIVHTNSPAAHPDIRAEIDAIPLPPTNAVAGWLVWDTGSNCYWRVSATNLRFYVWGVEP